MTEDALDRIALTQKEGVVDIFSQEGSLREKVGSSAHFSFQWFATLRAGIATANQVACTEGCAHCCYQRVSLNPAEAFHIAWFVDGPDFPTERREAVKAEVNRIWRNEDRLGSAERCATRKPCPFLDAGDKPLCLIYPVRPLSCRWYESMDEAACAAVTGLDDAPPIPIDPRIEPLAQIVEQGLYQGLEPQGMRINNTLVMSGALSVIWEQADAFDEWCSARDPFTHVRVERVRQRDGEPISMPR